jgi:sugar/nucleoside kinase (ribokinase family)
MKLTPDRYIHELLVEHLHVVEVVVGENFTFGRKATGNVETLRRAGERIDVLVGSGEDASERFEPGELDPPPRTVVTTAGALGGWIRPGGPFRAAPLPGAIEDAYGCGDCFAAGLTFGLADGLDMDAAVALAARCGAAVLCGRGAYGGQLAAGASGPPTRFDHIS